MRVRLLLLELAGIVEGAQDDPDAAVVVGPVALGDLEASVGVAARAAVEALPVGTQPDAFEGAIGFVDDDASLWGARLRDLPVFGGIEQLPLLVEESGGLAPTPMAADDELLDEDDDG